MHRAILLAEESWIAARVLRAWLEAGQAVVEAWCTGTSSLVRPVQQPLAWAFPDWSVRRILRRHGITVRRCPPLRRWTEAADAATRTGATVLVNLFGLQVIPAALLERFPGRAINVHPALLPRYRGPCPRVAMIAEGQADAAGGVSVHLLTEGIDEGPLVGARPVPFPESGGYAEWDARLADAAAALISAAVLPYLDGRSPAMPQDESLASYRRADAGEFGIGPATPLARARRLVDTLGRVGKLACTPGKGETPRATYRVGGIERVLGARTGRPPRIGRRTIDIDIADARVRLVRRRWRDRLHEQLDAVAALRRRVGRGAGTLP